MINLDTIPEKDLTKVRTIELDTGRTLKLVCTDPYGFWFFHLDKGQLPGWMTGAYSNVTEAEKALKKYLEEKEKTPPVILAPPEKKK